LASFKTIIQFCFPETMKNQFWITFRQFVLFLSPLAIGLRRYQQGRYLSRPQQQL
jgi:hypothetical protein